MLNFLFCIKLTQSKNFSVLVFFLGYSHERFSNIVHSIVCHAFNPVHSICTEIYIEHYKCNAVVFTHIEQIKPHFILVL